MRKYTCVVVNIYYNYIGIRTFVPYNYTSFSTKVI